MRTRTYNDAVLEALNDVWQRTYRALTAPAPDRGERRVARQEERAFAALARAELEDQAAREILREAESAGRVLSAREFEARLRAAIGSCSSARARAARRRVEACFASTIANTENRT
jgi:hypothetical protein